MIEPVCQPSEGRYGEASASSADIRRQASGWQSVITRSQFSVVSVLPDDDDLASDGLTWLVASTAQRSTHPLAQAIVQFARERGQKLAELTVFKTLPGYGARATVDERVVLIGSRALMRDEKISLGTLEKRAAELESIGRTVVYVAVDGLKAGAMVIEDQAFKLVHEQEPTQEG